MSYLDLNVNNSYNTGWPKMISTNLKNRTPVRYGLFCRNYDTVFFHKIFVMFVYLHYLYNLKAKL